MDANSRLFTAKQRLEPRFKILAFRTVATTEKSSFYLKRQSSTGHSCPDRKCLVLVKIQLSFWRILSRASVNGTEYSTESPQEFLTTCKISSLVLSHAARASAAAHGFTLQE